MKKYISIIICAVLLAFAFISNTQTESEIISGRGNGVDSKVTTAEEFVDVLNYFNHYKMLSAEEGKVENSNNLYASELNTKANSLKYTSATFYNKSRISMEYVTDGSDYSEKQKTNMTRELTINFTETAALYHSVGTIMQSSKMQHGEEKIDSSMYFDFDMEIYMTTKVCYIKFNKFNIFGDDSAPDIKNNMLNKWYNAGSLEEDLLDINQANIAILGSIGDYFEEYQFSKFDQKNKTYVLEKNYFQEVFSSIIGVSVPKDIKGEFIVNLSEETQPKIKLLYSYNDNGTAWVNAYEENNIIISYINNTIIDASNLPKNPPMLEDFVD